MGKSETFSALRTAILGLELAPGASLDETALCREYGISRTPMREILHRFAAEGLVTLEANRGAKVSSMDLPVMRSFFQAAPMIYAATARLAAENATRGQIGVLKTVQRGFRAAVEGGEVREMALLNHRFHEEIGGIADSPYLMPSLQRLLIDHTRMSQTFYDARDAADRTRIETACEQHDAMIDALESHEPARAVELTLDHWALSRDRIERFVRPDPLPLDPAQEVRDAV